MAINQVEFDLGTAANLRTIFSFCPLVASQKIPAVLKDAIEHSVNQTLLRDLNFGAWANVFVPNQYKWNDDDVYRIKITSPNADQSVGPYQVTLPKFLQAISLGQATYVAQQPALTAQIAKLIAEGNEQRQASANKSGRPFVPLTPEDFKNSFLPPFGLSMVNTDSIQLLHYPPIETVTYMDYLYSPTNRRWENLLAYNQYVGWKNTLVETIVDIAPIAADGGASGGDLIEPVLEAFQPYAMQMLQALLRTSPSGKTTQPIVAYGGPVGQWLMRNFNEELREQGVNMDHDKDGNPSQPSVGQAFTLHLFGNAGPATPVLTANHPIMFNYYDKDYESAVAVAPPSVAGQNAPQTQSEVDLASAIILAQDLTAAGWQTEMAQNWMNDPDPRAVFKEQCARWCNVGGAYFQAHFFDIFQEQVREFSLQELPVVNTAAWMKQLQTAIDIE